MSDSTTERLEQALAALTLKHAPDTEVREIRWSGGVTRVLELGEGPALLLVHGGLGSSLEWIPILASFSRVRRVLAIDRPGHGLASPFVYRGLDLATHGSEFLREILDVLEVDRVDLVGNSIGGFLATSMALACPERVERLALIGKPLGLNRHAPGPLRLLGMPVIGRLLGQLLMSSPSPKANRKFWGDLLVANPQTLDDALIDGDCAHQSRNLDSLLGLVQRVAGPGGVRRELMLGEKWAELSMPTLLLWGDRDEFGSPQEAEPITRANPNAQLVEVPGAGHLPWLDNPEFVTTALERFLEERRPSVVAEPN